MFPTSYHYFTSSSILLILLTCFSSPEKGVFKNVSTLRYSKISDSYLPSQIQGEAATLLIDKIQDPQQLTLLFRDGHTENPNIPAVSNNMVYEAAEFARLIDQLQQALKNDSTDGIPSLIRHSWLKASCLELEIMDTVRRQQKILFPADH